MFQSCVTTCSDHTCVHVHVYVHVYACMQLNGLLDLSSIQVSLTSEPSLSSGQEASDMELGHGKDIRTGMIPLWNQVKQVMQCVLGAGEELHCDQVDIIISAVHGMTTPPKREGQDDHKSTTFRLVMEKILVLFSYLVKIASEQDLTDIVTELDGDVRPTHMCPHVFTCPTPR